MAATNIYKPIGAKFNRWTIIGPAKRLDSSAQRRWVYPCRCECGVERAVNAFRLVQGISKSCGCLAHELSSRRLKTHGMTNTKEFSSWRAMYKRCYEIGRKDSHVYHDKGIKVCDRWLGPNGFQNFYNDMGPRAASSHIGAPRQR